MSHRLFKFSILLLFSIVPLSALAQEKTSKLSLGIEETTPEKTEKNKAEASKLTYQEALKAKNKGEFERALVLLEQAYNRDKNALYLFERALVLEQMGEKELALRVLDENAEALQKHPDVTNLAVVRERISNHQNQEKENLDKSESSLLGPITTSAGVAMLVGGIVTIILSKGMENDAMCNSNLKNPSCDRPKKKYQSEKDIQNQLDNANMLNITGWVLSSLGVIASGAGLYLWTKDNEDKAMSFGINPHDHTYSIKLNWTW